MAIHENEALKQKQKTGGSRSEKQHKSTEKISEAKGKKKKKSLGPVVNTQTIENSALAKASQTGNSPEHKVLHNISKVKDIKNQSFYLSKGTIKSCVKENSSKEAEKNSTPKETKLKLPDVDKQVVTELIPVSSSSDIVAQAALSKAKKRRLRKKRAIESLGPENKQLQVKTRKKRRKKHENTHFPSFEERDDDDEDNKLVTEFSNLSGDFSLKNVGIDVNKCDSPINKNNICSLVSSKKTASEDLCSDNAGHSCSDLRSSYSQGNTLPNCTDTDNFNSESDSVSVINRKQKKNKHGTIISSSLLPSEHFNGLFSVGLQNDFLTQNNETKVKKIFSLNDANKEKNKCPTDLVTKLPKNSGNTLPEVKHSSENSIKGDSNTDKDSTNIDSLACSVNDTGRLSPKLQSIPHNTKDKLLKNSYCTSDLPTALSLQRSVLISGPIYTSPNLENRVTSSAESNQIFNVNKKSLLSSSICSTVSVNHDSDKSLVPSNDEPAATNNDSSDICLNRVSPLTDKNCNQKTFENKSSSKKTKGKEIPITAHERKPKSVQKNLKRKSTAAQEINETSLLRSNKSSIENPKDLQSTNLASVENVCDTIISAADKSVAQTLKSKSTSRTVIEKGEETCVAEKELPSADNNFQSRVGKGINEKEYLKGRTDKTFVTCIKDKTAGASVVVKSVGTRPDNKGSSIVVADKCVVPNNIDKETATNFSHKIVGTSFLDKGVATNFADKILIANVVDESVKASVAYKGSENEGTVKDLEKSITDSGVGNNDTEKGLKKGSEGQSNPNKSVENSTAQEKHTKKRAKKATSAVQIVEDSADKGIEKGLSDSCVKQSVDTGRSAEKGTADKSAKKGADVSGAQKRSSDRSFQKSAVDVGFEKSTADVGFEKSAAGGSFEKTSADRVFKNSTAGGGFKKGGGVDKDIGGGGVKKGAAGGVLKGATCGVTKKDTTGRGTEKSAAGEGIKKDAAGRGAEKGAAGGGVEKVAAGGGVEKGSARGGVEKTVAGGGVEKGVAVRGFEKDTVAKSVTKGAAHGGNPKDTAGEGVTVGALEGGIEKGVVGIVVKDPAVGGIEKGVVDLGVEKPAVENIEEIPAVRGVEEYPVASIVEKVLPGFGNIKKASTGECTKIDTAGEDFKKGTASESVTKGSIDNCFKVSEIASLTMPKSNKSREEIKAEREAKKLAKQAKKVKTAVTNEQTSPSHSAATPLPIVLQDQSSVNDSVQAETIDCAATIQQPSAAQEDISSVDELDHDSGTINSSEVVVATGGDGVGGAAVCPDISETVAKHLKGPHAQTSSKGTTLDTEQPNVSDAFKLDAVEDVTDLSQNQININCADVNSASEHSNTSDAVKLVDGIHATLLTSSGMDLNIVGSDGQVSVAQSSDPRPKLLSQAPATINKRINASDDEKVKERSAIMNQRTDCTPVAPRPGEKSRAELRAERRAKQEAQRAAKLQNQQQKGADQKDESKSKSEKQSNLIKDKQVPNKSKAGVTVSKVTLGLADVQHKVKLFNHLYLHQKDAVSTAVRGDIMLHPAIVRLGIQYKTRVIAGSNSRCVALLHAVKQVIDDYQTPSQQEFSRGLESCLRSLTTYLNACRPLPVSATNALRHLKWQLTLLPNNVTDTDAKKKLHDSIDTYIRDQIDVADQAICNTVLDKITNGDMILTYGCSSLIARILLKAHESGKKFEVVVADGRPWLEGREMLRRLIQNGLKCSYVLLPAASFIMREVSKVFLGAHALLANGYVMSRAGSSQIALLAHTYNVPVLVCCETHKFSERVQTDSFVYNEIGDPDALGVRGWHEVGCLTPLNLTYDVTPPDLVTAVVTELSILPCTSVPVILRIKPSEAGF